MRLTLRFVSEGEDFGDLDSETIAMMIGQTSHYGEAINVRPHPGEGAFEVDYEVGESQANHLREIGTWTGTVRVQANPDHGHDEFGTDFLCHVVDVVDAGEWWTGVSPSRPEQPHPCISFMATTDWVADLRGYRYFVRARETQWRRPPEHRYVSIHTAVQELPTTSCPDSILFLPTIADPMVYRYARWRTKYKLPTVVDITGDVFSAIPKDLVSEEMSQAGQALPDKDWEHWAEPKNRALVAKLVDVATVVITSWADLVAPLTDLTDAPVLHIPDLHPGRKSLAAFAENMAGVFTLLGRPIP